ncbi:MAG: hypothetical protein H7Z75_22730, partial [Ferruginibacter sp.]|nr:hypothetical protein [Cytophagales bacterium]
MKKIIFATLAAVCCLCACKSTLPTAGTNDASSLNGTWVLNQLSGTGVAFEELDPEKNQ